MDLKQKAIENIKLIYKNKSSLKEEAMEALGLVGGEEAMQAIMSIYNKKTALKAEAMIAIGNAVKNS